jgi:hypothetical protein
MAQSATVAGSLSEVEHARQLRRAIIAGTVGTIIEAYDFLLYVIVAPLVFAKLYFPASTPSALSPARSARHCSVILGTASAAK